MIRQVVVLTVTWVFLMALAGAEFMVSGLELGLANRAVILAFALAMLTTIAMMFMRLYSAPTLAKVFALMAVVWIVLLFGLGSMDALTRSWYPVVGYNPR